MSNTTQKPRLGKGLEALFQSKSYFASGRTITNIPIKEIVPNPYQPRLQFNEEALRELSESIKKHGVAQPILVRKQPHGYELIAGERRLRASELAGIDTIPGIIREISDLEAVQLALIENLEREDLNAVEEAKGYKKLIDDFGMSHQDLADQFGKSRSSITNTLRLLKLPSAILDSIMNGEISEGHARALLSLDTMETMLEYLDKILKEELSVRELEYQLAKNPSSKKKKEKKTSPYPEIEKFIKAQGMKLKIKGTKKKGTLQLAYRSEEEFQAIMEKIG